MHRLLVMDEGIVDGTLPAYRGGMVHKGMLAVTFCWRPLTHLRS